jgi:outer membrane protein assembly factor BamB
LKPSRKSRLILAGALLPVVLLLSCNQIGKTVFVPPEKNVLPDYQSSTAKHRVLQVVWRKGLVDPDNISLDQHHHGTPATSQDGRLVYAGGVDGSFHCFDTKKGKLVWRKFTEGPVESEPTVKDGTVYVGSGDGNLYAFRASDGELLWTYRTAASLPGRPVVTGDNLLIMTHLNNLICLDANTGKWRWGYRRDVPVGRFQVKGVANPTVSGDSVYAGFSDGALVALSLKDGSPREVKHLAGTKDRFLDVDTDPLLIDKTLYAASFKSGVLALDPKDLKERWRYEVEGPSSLAHQDGFLYFTTANSTVVALDAEKGKPVWTFSARKGGLSRPVVVGRWLLISSEEYSLMALDRHSGTLVQLFNPGKGASAAPAVAGSRIFWVSNGETLYSMELVQ